SRTDVQFRTRGAAGSRNIHENTRHQDRRVLRVLPCEGEAAGIAARERYFRNLWGCIGIALNNLANERLAFRETISHLLSPLRLQLAKGLNGCFFPLDGPNAGDFVVAE